MRLAIWFHVERFRFFEGVRLPLCTVSGFGPPGASGGAQERNFWSIINQIMPTISGNTNYRN